MQAELKSKDKIEPTYDWLNIIIIAHYIQFDYKSNFFDKLTGRLIYDNKFTNTQVCSTHKSAFTLHIIRQVVRGLRKLCPRDLYEWKIIYFIQLCHDRVLYLDLEFLKNKFFSRKEERQGGSFVFEWGVQLWIFWKTDFHSIRR